MVIASRICSALARRRGPRGVLRRARSMNPFHTRAPAVVALLLVVASLGGCARGDECESGQYRCDGDVASTCRLQIDDAHYFYWDRLPCGAGLCRTDSASAFCTLSATPEPSCKADTQTSCVGSSVVVCRAGYAVSKTEC